MWFKSAYYLQKFDALILNIIFETKSNELTTAFQLDVATKQLKFRRTIKPSETMWFEAITHAGRIACMYYCLPSGVSPRLGDCKYKNIPLSFRLAQRPSSLQT